MIGFRGASRYYNDRYRSGFALECRAIRRVREEMGLTNLKVMIPFVQVAQNPPQFPVYARSAEELAIGFCGHREPIRHAHPARRQFAIHFAQGRVLSTNKWDIIDAEFFEPADEFVTVLLAHVIFRSSERVLTGGAHPAANGMPNWERSRPPGFCAHRFEHPAFTLLIRTA